MVTSEYEHDRQDHSTHDIFIWAVNSEMKRKMDVFKRPGAEKENRRYTYRLEACGPVGARLSSGEKCHLSLDARHNTHFLKTWGTLRTVDIFIRSFRAPILRKTLQ